MFCTVFFLPTLNISTSMNQILIVTHTHYTTDRKFYIKLRWIYLSKHLSDSKRRNHENCIFNENLFKLQCVALNSPFKKTIRYSNSCAAQDHRAIAHADLAQCGDTNYTQAQEATGDERPPHKFSASATFRSSGIPFTCKENTACTIRKSIRH